MRLLQYFIPTLKESPKDAVLKSHQLLVRAGYIHQVGSGIYHFLPLGRLVLDKISAIIKDEMQKAGAIELSLGFVTPASLWQQTGRFEKYGKELLSFKDRKENDFVLSPTCEESITDLAKQFIKSYKNLPKNFYHINLKFRDEVRPRFGLLRGREFVMKDAYSFHESYEDLEREFLNMQQAYYNIFSRLGLDFRVVEADSGAIGGSGSREFMVLADSGEDTIAICNSCSYAANLEAAKRKKRQNDAPPPKAKLAKFPTPNVKKIEEVAEFFKVDSFYILKAVVKKVIFSAEMQRAPELAYFFIRGDDELEDVKALNALNAQNLGALELVDASVEEIRSVGLYEGFIGPYALKNITGSELIYFDLDLEEESGLICGGNELDSHFVGVDLSEFEGLRYADLACVKEGDLCPLCGGSIRYKKGIEVGHIFKLGTRYSEALNAQFLDQNGKARPFIMGCYGIGVSRLIPAVLEQKADELGCVWGEAIAPFDVVLLVSNLKDEKQRNFSDHLYDELMAEGLNVLYDDRNERFGFKMKDFELVGISYGVVIGNALENGEVEVIKRDGMKKVISKSQTKAILEAIRTLGGEQ